MTSKQSQDVFEHLHHLIKKGDRAKVREWTAGGGDANLRTKHGWSLLMLAALHGRTDIVEVLLAAGAMPIWRMILAIPLQASHASRDSVGRPRRSNVQC